MMMDFYCNDLWRESIYREFSEYSPYVMDALVRETMPLTLHENAIKKFSCFETC